MSATAAADEAEVFATDRLIAQARRLARDYRRATGRPLAGISNEVAVYDAARLLDLELSGGQAGGYDAVGRGSRAGRRIQIKGRVIFNDTRGGQRVGQLKLDRDWDSVMLVLMDEDFLTCEIHEALRADIVESLSGNSARNRRGAMSVSRFKLIGSLVWTRENGAEDELWENR